MPYDCRDLERTLGDLRNFRLFTRAPGDKSRIWLRFLYFVLRLSDNRSVFLSNLSSIKLALRLSAPTQAYNVSSLFLKCLIQFKIRNGDSGVNKRQSDQR